MSWFLGGTCLTVLLGHVPTVLQRRSWSLAAGPGRRCARAQAITDRLMAVTLLALLVIFVPRYKLAWVEAQAEAARQQAWNLELNRFVDDGVGWTRADVIELLGPADSHSDSVLRRTWEYTSLEVALGHEDTVVWVDRTSD